MKPAPSRTTDWRQRCKTLERLAAKVLEPIGLQHQRTRLRTGSASGAVVDTFFKSSRLRFRTWNVLCKDSGQLSLDDAATEVGIAQGSGNRVAVVISTGKVSETAREYARCVNSTSPISVILLGKADLAAIRRREDALSRLIERQAPTALVTAGLHPT